MTSSSFPKSAAMQDKCRPAVQFETVVENLAPVYLQNKSSNFRENFPWANQPLLRTSFTD